MRSNDKWNTFNVLRYIQWAAIVVPIPIAMSLKIDAKTWGGPPKVLLESVQNSAPWLIPVLAGIAFGAKSVGAMIGPPRLWKTVQRILDLYREKAFVMPDGAAVHEHRVTLFKHVHWGGCFWKGARSIPGIKPWDGWLVPVARSGHTTQKSRTVFPTPDNPNQAEGIAGQAWVCGAMILERDLPDLKAEPTLENIRIYAEKTFSRPEWVKARLADGTLSRSLCGIPVENNGTIWGVIVLDSVHPRAIDNDGAAWEHYGTLIPNFLGQLLGKG